MSTPSVPRRIYLHIGHHKTGTTWIQNVLDHNRARLAAHGVLYPDLGACHGWPLVHMFGAPEHIARRSRPFGRNLAESLVAAKARSREVLRDALHPSAAPKVILSGEQLYDMLRPDDLKRMAEAFDLAGVETRVIVYVREPVAYAVSMTQQRLKAGRTLRDLALRPPLPAYRQRIGRYRRAFGTRNVEIRVYDRARLRDGDVLADFLEAVGEPGLEAALDRPARLNDNTAMTRRAAQLHDLRNRMMEAFSMDFARRNPTRILRRLETLRGPRFDLPDAVKSRVRQATRQDVAWLEKRLGHPPFPGRAAAPHAPEGAPA